MILYHGTSEAVARKALTEGLRPRRETGGDGNWKHTVKSNPDHVYLTAAYAPYFAAMACGEGERWALIEVETDALDEGLFVPDEDWLEQATRGQKMPRWATRARTMEGRTRWFRENLLAFQHLWRQSIEGMGNCAYYNAVPPTALRRIVLYAPRANRFISFTAIDPCITTLNYRFCGGRYRALTRWFFEPVEASEVVMGMEVQPEPQKKSFSEAVDCREGLELLRS